MKKIAFFVEGQTEMYFVNKLLKEVAGYKKMSVNLLQRRGGGRVQMYEIAVEQPHENPSTPQYEALIFDCGNDEKVASDMKELAENLTNLGYSEIVGLRDLYPETDLVRMRRGIRFFLSTIPNHFVPCSLIVAIREIEDWFLVEKDHYCCIDINLTEELILSSMIGFTPFTDDMSIRHNSASEDLRTIYQLVGKSYNKTKTKVERTVNCLNYTNLYLNVRNLVPELNELITIIDEFLT